MSTFDYNDLRSYQACVAKGHDFRLAGGNYYRCRCGASARVANGRIEIDNAVPVSKEEKAAEREARKKKFMEERKAFTPERRAR